MTGAGLSEDADGSTAEEAVHAEEAVVVDETVTAVETVTAGGSRPEDGWLLVDAAHRAQLATETEPNGWFAGPHADPDRFQLLGPGLAGGEGNTWQARYRGELTAPLTVAVKELRRPPQVSSDWPTPADVRRWEDQRALLQYMRIDHLVTMIDIFVGPPPHLPGPDGRRTPECPYVVMEWVTGPTLADQLSGDPATAATLDDRLAHVQHVAEALHSLHSRTVSAGNPTLHRDVKPTNCILEPRRGVVLVDVGTMRRMDDGYDDAGLHTPAYTAPEVLADPRVARAASSDLYSLGALAYFCVLGEDPPRPDLPGSAGQIEARLLIAAGSAGVRDVTGFVEQLKLMLDPQPDQRPADAMAWSRRLRSLAQGPVRRRLRALPSRPATATAAVLLVGVILVCVLAVTQFHSKSTSAVTDAVHPLTGASLASRAASPPASPPAGGFGGPPPPGSDPPPGLGPPPPGFGPPPAAGFVGGAPGGKYGPAGTGEPVTSAMAAITSPRNGAAVGQCTIFSGWSKLPVGRTLLLSVENLEMGDGVRHLRTVDGWQAPTTLAHWHGLQFVGLPQDPPGARFRVEVFVVSLTALKAQILNSAGRGPDAGIAVPPDSVVAASTVVSRSAADPGAQTCG